MVMKSSILSLIWSAAFSFCLIRVTESNIYTEPLKEWKEPWGQSNLGSRREYYACKQHQGCTKEFCPIKHVFDRTKLECVLTEDSHRQKRQIATVGNSCNQNTDCRRGAYCDTTKRCACLSTYVVIRGYCWRKINPGESGCQYQEQCNSVWPDSTCNGGQCRCGNGNDPFLTNDGYVCLNAGNCPINGQYTKLIDTSSRVVQCATNADCTRVVGTSYECVCQLPNCQNTAPRYCCPTRAMACIQAVDSGTTPSSGGGSITRYYYNSITETCQTFNYRGANGNANNFLTKNQCESYCMQYCQRGNPEYTSATGVPPKGTVKFCTGTGTSTCTGSVFECKLRGTRSICCTKPIEICGRNGGTGGSPTRGGNNYDVGILKGGTSTTYPRWYYDISNQRCQSFIYNGQGGNFNNFQSEDQCITFCSTVLCDQGEPLKENGLTNKACNNNGACGANYQCTSRNVCCPRKEYLCALPQARGPCSSPTARYFYDATRRNCIQFTYSGCQGNDNNFQNYDDCINFCRDVTAAPKCPQGDAQKDSSGNYLICGGTSTLTGITSTCSATHFCYYDGTTYGCCPTQAYTCSLTFQSGTLCKDATPTRWYFDPAVNQCKTFTYNGCDGNSNNFGTQADCRDYCQAGGCPDGGEPFKENNGQYRVCSQNRIACPNSHFCTQVTTISNFRSSSTNNYCCPTKTYICSQPRDSGVNCAGSSLTRYFFNAVTRTCESFQYQGCDGNRNNFATLSQCANYCNSAGCGPGQEAQRDLNNNRLITCQTGTNTCNTGYTCTFSSLLGQNVCCGVRTSPGTCPNGESGYVDAFTQDLKTCQTGITGSCPAPFYCFFSATQGRDYCCGSGGVTCPNGESVIQVNGRPQQCTPGLSNNCPANAQCQSTQLNVGTILSTTGYCCGTSAGSSCPTSYTPSLVNGQPLICQTIGQQGPCPQGSRCFADTTAGNTFGVQNPGYCCSPDLSAIRQVCSSVNLEPYVLASAPNAPVLCSAGSANTRCPPPYSCQVYRVTGSSYCCRPRTSNPVNNNQGCPPNYTPVFENGVRRACTTVGNNCGAGRICQFDSTTQAFGCCQSINSQQPVVVQTVRCLDRVTTTSTTCTGTGTCINNLSCDLIGNQRYCCPRVVCAANNQSPYQNPSDGNRYLGCQLGVSGTCPGGYSCQTVSGSATPYCCPGQSFVNPQPQPQPQPQPTSSKSF